MRASVTRGASDTQAVTQREGHRSTALRPRQLVRTNTEIAEVTERLALTPLTTVKWSWSAIGAGKVSHEAPVLIIGRVAVLATSGGHNTFLEPPHRASEPDLF